eukprot:2289638-Pyramimonas_sp.AAC.1
MAPAGMPRRSRCSWPAPPRGNSGPHGGHPVADHAKTGWASISRKRSNGVMQMNAPCFAMRGVGDLTRAGCSKST